MHKELIGGSTGNNNTQCSVGGPGVCDRLEGVASGDIATVLFSFQDGIPGSEFM